MENVETPKENGLDAAPQKKRKVSKGQVVVEASKLDLGCGDNKREGFSGVDKFKTPSVDIVHDLFSFPWPFKDKSIEEIHSSHFFEHIPAHTRPKFMDELFRVMKPGAKGTIIIPYGLSRRAIQDFTHEWPPICESSFLYYNKGWREQNKLTHGYYSMKCDFDFSYNWQITNPFWATKHTEAQQHALTHYWDVATDMLLSITRREDT